MNKILNNCDVKLNQNCNNCIGRTTIKPEVNLLPGIVIALLTYCWLTTAMSTCLQCGMLVIKKITYLSYWHLKFKNDHLDGCLSYHTVKTTQCRPPKDTGLLQQHCFFFLLSFRKKVNKHRHTLGLRDAVNITYIMVVKFSGCKGYSAVFWGKYCCNNICILLTHC